MKFFLFLLICASIGCSINSTSAGRPRSCESQGGTPLTQRCIGAFAESECMRKCHGERNSERGECINGGCCCFGETNGFPYGRRWK